MSLGGRRRCRRRRRAAVSAALVQAMSVARNGLCNLGDGVRMSAHNYSLAEAMSDVAGRAGGDASQAGQRFGRGETGSAVPDLGEQPGGADGAGAGQGGEGIRRV